MVWWTAVTKNILTNEQMTTTANSSNLGTSSAKNVDTKKTTTSTSSTLQSTKKFRWKWSGEEDSLERGWDDTDTGTCTQEEKNYARWYNATKNKWHDADTD